MPAAMRNAAIMMISVLAIELTPPRFSNELSTSPGSVASETAIDSIMSTLKPEMAASIEL